MSAQSSGSAIAAAAAKSSGYNEARALGNAVAGLVATVAATGAGTGIGRCVMMEKHRDLMCHTPP